MADSAVILWVVGVKTEGVMEISIGDREEGDNVARVSMVLDHSLRVRARGGGQMAGVTRIIEWARESSQGGSKQGDIMVGDSIGEIIIVGFIIVGVKQIMRVFRA